MAVRTGAQLKTDQAAADSALATAIATPTEANINSAITAFSTVVTNGNDSAAIVAPSPVAPASYASSLPHIPSTTQMQTPGREVASLARAARRELQLVNRSTLALAQGVATSADVAKMLRRVQKNLEFGPWASLRRLPTTD